MASPKVVVVGSCMIDLVSYAPCLPRPGETVHGSHFQRGFGGKGANQCVAAARLGASTALVARVGDDDFGREYAAALGAEGIVTDFVMSTPGSVTGMAQITVADTGENQIVIVGGANGHLELADVQAAKGLLSGASVLLLQLETPQQTSLEALRLAPATCKRIVNAAPATADLDPKMFTECDVFCVNETEAQKLTSVPVDSVASASEAAQNLLQRGCKAVIVTLGSQGAVLLQYDQDSACHVSSPSVHAVDTTGAGDAFLGALAYYLAYCPNLPLQEVVKRSCSIAAVSVQSLGTQGSFPRRNNLPNVLFCTC